MPEPPAGFILISGGSYFNPSTGTYWMAPTPTPAPVQQTVSQPSVVQAPAPTQKVTQYALERTSTTTGKTEYATPSGGWSSVNPGPIVTTRAPTTTPFVKETSAQVTKSGDSTPQTNAPLRQEVVDFIQYNYEGHLSRVAPGEKGYEDYMRVYNTFAPQIAEAPTTGKFWDPIKGIEVSKKTEAETFVNQKGYALEDVKEFSFVGNNVLAGFVTKSGQEVISGEIAGRYNLKSEAQNPIFGLFDKGYPFPVYTSTTKEPTTSDYVSLANEAGAPQAKGVGEAQAEVMTGGSAFGIGTGLVGIQGAKTLWGKKDITVNLPGVKESNEEYFINPDYQKGMGPLQSLTAGLFFTSITPQGREAMGRAVSTTGFEFTKGVGALAGTAIDIPFQVAKDTPKALSYIQAHPAEAAMLGGSALVIGAGSSMVAMGQDVGGAIGGQPGALGRTALTIALFSTPLLPKLGKWAGTSNIEFVNPGAGLRPTTYGIFKAGEVGTTPVGTLYNRPLANVKAPQIISKAVEKVWLPERIMTEKGYAYAGKGVELAENVPVDFSKVGEVSRGPSVRIGSRGYKNMPASGELPFQESYVPAGKGVQALPSQADIFVSPVEKVSTSPRLNYQTQTFLPNEPTPKGVYAYRTTAPELGYKGPPLPPRNAPGPANRLTITKPVEIDTGGYMTGDFTGVSVRQKPVIKPFEPTPSGVYAYRTTAPELGVKSSVVQKLSPGERTPFTFEKPAPFSQPPQGTVEVPMAKGMSGVQITKTITEPRAATYYVERSAVIANPEAIVRGSVGTSGGATASIPFSGYVPPSQMRSVIAREQPNVDLYALLREGVPFDRAITEAKTRQFKAQPREETEYNTLIYPPGTIGSTKAISVERTGVSTNVKQIQGDAGLWRSGTNTKAIQMINQKVGEFTGQKTSTRTGQLSGELSITKTITRQDIGTFTGTKTSTDQTTKQLTTEIPFPVIPVIKTPEMPITKKPGKPPPPDIQIPKFPILLGPSKKSSRNWPSMGGLGKLGSFKTKRKLQPLLQPFEQLRIEQRTGKALSAFVPSTPKTRAIYAKNMFGALGKSGLEGMFKTKKKRR
jgi:hypothetical protein